LRSERCAPVANFAAELQTEAKQASPNKADCENLHATTHSTQGIGRKQHRLDIGANAVEQRLP
jgi:hypothetical protein